MLATDEKRGLGGGGGRGAAAAATVDLERNRFPFSIVWQPFPVLGWILPCIGHMGICDSEGVVHDFQGPYTIIKDNMMLGSAARYIPLEPSKIRATPADFGRAELAGEVDAYGAGRGPPETQVEIYDACVRAGCCDYSKRIHCLLYPNCNHHVAHCLNVMKYKGWSHWGMLSLWVWVFFGARFAGVKGVLSTCIPFLLVVGIGCALGFGTA